MSEAKPKILSNPGLVFLAVVDRRTADPMWLEPAGVFGPFDSDATALGWFAAHAPDCVPCWDQDQSLEGDGLRWFWYTFTVHPGTPEALATALGKTNPDDTRNGNGNGFRAGKGTRLVYLGPPVGDLQPGHYGIVTAVDPPPAMYVVWDCGVTTTVTDETTVSVVDEAAAR